MKPPPRRWRCSNRSRVWEVTLNDNDHNNIKVATVRNLWRVVKLLEEGVKRWGRERVPADDSIIHGDMIIYHRWRKC